MAERTQSPNLSAIATTNAARVFVKSPDNGERRTNPKLIRSPSLNPNPRSERWDLAGRAGFNNSITSAVEEPADNRIRIPSPFGDSR